MKIAVIFGTVITLLLLPIGALLGCQQQPQPVQTPSPTPSTVLKVKTMILLNSGFDIHIMNADDSDPYWSRDGSLIAFTSNRDRKEEVYVMYANGSDQHPVIEKYMPIPTPMPPPPPAPIFPIISTIIFCILAWMFWLLLGKTTFGISRAAVLATAIPQAVLAIAIYTIGLLFQPLSRIEIGIAQYCLNVGAVIAVLAILSSVIFAIMRKWEIAKGTAICGGIGLVVWTITFALSYGMGLG